MTNPKTTFGLSSKKLAQLFTVGSDLPKEEVHINQDDHMDELLRDLLAKPLPMSGQEVPKEDEIQRLITARSKGSIGRFLSDPGTDVALIRRIKDYGRKLSASAKSKEEHRAANALYYLAIAHALVNQGTRISSFSPRQLADSFCRLCKETWIPEDLVGLLKKASETAGDL
jgi:hypothetical protein